MSPKKRDGVSGFFFVPELFKAPIWIVIDVLLIFLLQKRDIETQVRFIRYISVENKVGVRYASPLVISSWSLAP